MQTFILLTRLISEEVSPSFTIRLKEERVVSKIRESCPEVTWIHDYTVLGPWDYVDIFRAPDMDTAFKVSALVRLYGGAHTEIWPVIEWKDFDKVMRELTDHLG